MIAQALVSFPPQVGMTISLRDASEIGHFRVLDVVHHIRCEFEFEIARVSELIEAGVERPNLPLDDRISVFVERADAPFDRVEPT